MKTALLSTILLALPALSATVNFDNTGIGELPSGWTATQTGDGKAVWTVERDPTAPSQPGVLKQSGQAAYPLCLADTPPFKDGFVEVKFKPVAGQEDQAGGVVWRAKDAANYYIARANALENNVRIYHFVNGKRTQFKGANLTVSPNQWHTLRVTFSSDRFTVIFDGKDLFSAQDNTHPDAGRVGVWTKADSITLFDDFACGTE